ncbi:hypothetical protein NM688_g7501 [Phlebia brevispora]|uniref:Uncharacterized protein n=1 Tax=Phlebia brevispora TaxID=194682 RepID=A0ACC1S4P1_9APHY|nr:hypothetical protein NM688_g7501 [Phlebia brevispora]
MHIISIFLSAVLFSASNSAVNGLRSISTTLHAVADGEDLGPIYAVGPSVSLQGTGPGTLFYIEDTLLYADELAVGSANPEPHGYIAFLPSESTETSCTESGPLVFAQSTDDPCAVDAPFAFAGSELVFDGGSFEVCGPGQIIEYTEAAAVASTSCTLVELVIPPSATPV